ncbi:MULTISPECIES: magnesium/cobalt transporter CorA [Cohnella]|uniref:magnesium/cobalt transporter CorA n=1 Tax=Cohnella TaxID=329857 RepID=UPI0009BB2954|nr:magnesium/cobalt transporter CorA [Cohnella massiliensis]MBN2983705.1 magnesium/cobalt transporter CorA [Cohnella algarum]
MIRTFAVFSDERSEAGLPLADLRRPDISWYWVDFNAPTEEEALELERFFRFHPLAIEDCYHILQRPKLDHYDDVHFFVLHALEEPKLKAQEVDMFVGENFLVTFHMKTHVEADLAWQRMTEQRDLQPKGPIYAMYLLIDKLVDQYFPAVHHIEDDLLEIETNGSARNIQRLMNDVFEIRAKLLKLRRTIVPMRDLLYRIINSDRIPGLKEQQAYFADIYDHLLKLSEMIESNRDMTADMRDSYLSVNSNRMNTIMKTLTVITTIFMPLTFIAGIYGMNFDFMPELRWRWGYFAILAVMFGIGFGMYGWFRRKKWFD